MLSQLVILNTKSLQRAQGDYIFRGYSQRANLESITFFCFFVKRMFRSVRYRT